ncbi:MFS transporter [Pedobacter sp. Leaf216]|uniref:DHA2 family efflux MFS transporter permease subunit n=1 Tax=Pedobacter sp. Leaf216 TaxID=1735684 RepID=UPI0006FA9857|nr:DHA2 family efflux MFS transporter permease subunit [Pedobacter sp. Leaf216]KQM76977.1 MFS transporter [Pedobacter sp. Leaf216]
MEQTSIQKKLPWIAALAMFMQSLDGTILNTALPSIAADLHKPPLTLQSIIISYVLVLALLIPLSGWLSDRFGSKNVFVIAIAIFTVGSLCCALSQSLTALIVSRVIQAIGGSMMVPVSRLAILYTYEKEKLLGVINFITIPGLVGPIIGPTLGGWLVEIASWHWIFIINIPIGIFGIYYAAKNMPQYKRPEDGFDFLGMLLFGGSLLLLTLGIELGTHDIIHESILLSVFATSFVLMNLYYFHFRRLKERALINLSLIRIKTLRIGVFGNLLTRLGIGGMPLLLPLLFQLGLKQSAMTSGIMLIPVALTSVIIKSWVVPIVKKLGYKNTLIINTMIIAIVIGLFSLVDAHTKLANLIPLLVIYGAVNSIQLTSMNTISLSALDNETASSGNSLLLVMQQLSMSLGISVGAFLLAKYSDKSWLQTENVFIAFKYTFLTLASITAVTSLIFLRLDKTAGENLSGHH